MRRPIRESATCTRRRDFRSDRRIYSGDTPVRHLDKLRAEKILVRWWDYPNVRDYLRITIGTDKEMSALLRAAKRIISKREKARR